VPSEQGNDQHEAETHKEPRHEVGQRSKGNRTAVFAFMIGDRFFSTVMVFVPGEVAGRYEFSSSLAVQVFNYLEPTLKARLTLGAIGGSLSVPTAAQITRNRTAWLLTADQRHGAANAERFQFITQSMARFQLKSYARVLALLLCTAGVYAQKPQLAEIHRCSCARWLRMNSGRSKRIRPAGCMFPGSSSREAI